MELRADLATDPVEVGRARSLVAARLLDLGVGDEVVEVIVLLVSELVTNAVRHAHAPIRLTLMTTADDVRVEVVDGDASRIPVLQETGLDQPGGRGLRLVDALARSWGVSADDAGKCVWFEVGRSASAP
ncbi:MAG: hypothetical protein QOJ60_380 [Actinomycetota bacterium]|nr:hypothetical protein [Actinomycetota bacterium]